MVTKDIDKVYNPVEKGTIVNKKDSKKYVIKEF